MGCFGGKRGEDYGDGYEIIAVMTATECNLNFEKT